jgi:hypothetical protein
MRFVKISLILSLLALAGCGETILPQDIAGRWREAMTAKEKKFQLDQFDKVGLSEPQRAELLASMAIDFHVLDLDASYAELQLDGRVHDHGKWRLEDGKYLVLAIELTNTGRVSEHRYAIKKFSPEKMTLKANFETRNPLVIWTRKK